MTPSQHELDTSGIETLAARVRVNPDTSISWFGKTAVPPLQVADELMPEALRSNLADIVYSAHYVFGATRPISAVDNGSPALSSNADLVRELLSAYRGRESWLPTFEAETDTDVMLWGVRFLRPEEKADDHGHRLPTALPMRSPGYLYFVGDQGPRDTVSPEQGPMGKKTVRDGMTRVYWNVSRQGAPKLVGSLTGAFNEQKVPFQFKVVHSASTWPERADIAVLYLPTSRLMAQWKTILAVHDEVRADLRSWTPAFTRRLAPGLAVADDPPGGLSFGQTVSRIVASGLVDDHIHNGARSTLSTRADHIRQALADSGRRVGATHLNPGNRELDLQVPADPEPTVRRPGLQVAPAVRLGPAAAARRAEQLADLVGKLAITVSDRCTWFTRGTDPDEPVELRTVGADFYDGLSGIALSLAHTYAVLGRSRHRELAEMAAASAMDHLYEVEHLHGLYGGRVGAVAAVAEVGRTIQHPGLWEAAIAQLLQVADDEPVDSRRDHDLIYGISGTVLAYCWAARAAGSDGTRRQLLDRATEFGRRLAARTASDLATGAAAGPDGPLPPGLAHGPSSSVLALAELSRLRGGDADLDQAAALAADYERRLFDHGTGNWPGGPSGSEESRFNWCYGSPGIAIARLASADRGVAADDLEVAVRGLDNAGARFLGRCADASACHGKLAIAGVAELVNRSTDLPVDPWLREELLAEALDYYNTPRVVRAAPGLMTGAAGAGLTALRECAPEDVPSPLYPLFPRRREEAHG